MFADKFERYEITHVPDGLQISLWQALPRLGFGVIALVILAACFATDPYQGHGRIWAGLGVLALALVALFGVRRENWIISESAVRYKSSLWNKELSFERSRETPLFLRMERIACDSEGTVPSFPNVVQLFGPGSIKVGDAFRFRERSTLDRFLQTLHDVSPITVEELPTANYDADEPSKPRSDMSSFWPD
jgi:hypothetical protein